MFKSLTDYINESRSKSLKEMEQEPKSKEELEKELEGLHMEMEKPEEGVDNKLKFKYIMKSGDGEDEMYVAEYDTEEDEFKLEKCKPDYKDEEKEMVSDMLKEMAKKHMEQAP